MTCVGCNRRPTADPDGVLCQLCLVGELVSLAEQRRELMRAELGNLPPDLRFLLDFMIDAGWSKRAVTGALHALQQPEEAVPAVFAHLVEL